MINGTVVPSVVILCTRHTNVRFEHNWTYDLSASAFTGLLPKKIPLEEGDNTDNENDLHEKSRVDNVPPTHTLHPLLLTHLQVPLLVSMSLRTCGESL